MKQLSRRQCAKQLLTSLAVLAAAPVSLPALEEDEKRSSRPAARDLFKRASEAKAQALLESALKAGREEVASQREVNASKRAAILLSPEAGKEHVQRAQMHYQARTEALRSTKQELAKFVQVQGASGEQRFKQFGARDNLAEFTKHVRQSAIQSLMNSDISPQEAQEAVKALDDRLNKVKALGSFRDLTSYFDQHLDELIARKMPEADPNGFCVLILILSSLYVIAVLTAVIICSFSPGSDCGQLLNQIIASICGSDP